MNSPLAPTHLTQHARAKRAFGATVLDNDLTRFTLWAPSATTASVVIEGREPVPMPAKADGWFTVDVKGCGAGALYRYCLGDSFIAPDPASRYQPDDVHGPSCVVDPSRYKWQHAGWQGRPWEEAVFYELHVGAMGGYAGVAQHLGRLAALGVTAIELMPVNEFSGTRNWGYDGALIYAPEASYGTPDELRALIDAAHGWGMMVFLDVVYNHFGPEGNYLSVFAKCFFKDGEKTPWGDAIDFERDEVRDFFYENALYWIEEFRFDGLRIDAAHAINDVPWLQGMAQYVRSHVEPARMVHLVVENEFNQVSLLGPGAFEAQWNDDAHNTLHVLLTGETNRYYGGYATDTMDKLVRVLSEGFVFQGEGEGHAGKPPRGQPSAGLPPTAFVMFLQNHDQVGNRAHGSRLIKLANVDALRAATVLLLLSPQIPLLFMGEEAGLKQPFLYFTDYQDTLADAVRRGRHAEFALESETDNLLAAIPDPNENSSFEASSIVLEDFQSSEAQPWITFYREALAMRHLHVVPRLRGARSAGTVRIGEADARAVIARWTLADGAPLSIVLNLGEHELEHACALDGAVIFETPAGAGRAIADGRVCGYSCTVAIGPAAA